MVIVTEDETIADIKATEARTTDIGAKRKVSQMQGTQKYFTLTFYLLLEAF